MGSKKDTEANNPISQALLSLCKIDSDLQEKFVERSKIEQRRSAMGAELERRRSMCAQAKTDLEEKTAFKDKEEQALRDEEVSILERRKSLSNISGAKAAKILERDLELSAAALDALEDRLQVARSGLEVAETRLEAVSKAVEELEMRLESEAQSDNQALDALAKAIGELEQERSEVSGRIDAQDVRVLEIYERIRSRHPGDSVAIVREGSCRSCYRALPPQLYNQVLSGNYLLQCPGCSRIMAIYQADVDSLAS